MYTMMVPKHVAIIMDGNGRWAKERGKIRLEGHKKGADILEEILAHSRKLGIKYLTVYAFSTENWKRSEEEVNGLMKLFYTFLDMKKRKLKKEGVRLFITGRKDKIDPKLLTKIEKTEEHLKDGDIITLNVAFNYGGRAEIIDGINKLIADGKKEITEEDFSSYMYRPEIPDPELVIRTSGEFRISNFLLWEVAYSEFYITDTYWPDFTTKEYEKAVESFSKRDRRYGGTDAK